MGLLNICMYFQKHDVFKCVTTKEHEYAARCHADINFKG